LLVYRPGALGDALVALPAVRLARQHFKANYTTIAAATTVAPLLVANRIAENVISADDHRLTPLLSGNIEELFATFGRIDVAVLWGGQTLSLAAQALRTVGVEVVHAPSRPPDDSVVHVSAHLASTISGNLEPSYGAEKLWPPPDDRAWFAAEFGPLLTRPMLAIHGGSGSPRKNWSPGSFAKIANILHAQHGLGVAVISGPADACVAETLLGALSEAPEIVARDWPLGRVAALLSSAAIYLGNDSGISHLAGCLGVRGVALFGPTRAEVWKPNGGTIVALQQPDMKQHLETAVLDALRAMLDSRSVPTSEPAVERFPCPLGYETGRGIRV
jgi:heptosyltransferase-2